MWLASKCCSHLAAHAPCRRLQWEALRCGALPGEEEPTAGASGYGGAQVCDVLRAALVHDTRESRHALLGLPLVR